MSDAPPGPPGAELPSGDLNPAALNVPAAAASEPASSAEAAQSAESSSSPSSSRKGSLVRKTFGNTAESNARRFLAALASGLHDPQRARQAIADLEASAARARFAGESPDEALGLAARIAAALSAGSEFVRKSSMSQPPSPCKGTALDDSVLDEWECPDTDTDEVSVEEEARRKWREEGDVEISELDEDRGCQTALPENWVAAALAWKSGPLAA